MNIKGFPGGSDGKESACNAGHSGSIHGMGRYPGEGNGNPLQNVHTVVLLVPYCYRLGEGDGTLLQHSCLENPMDGGAWWAAVHGVTKSRTRLSDFRFTFHFHALEKVMETHSSVLAWRIPGTGEPVGCRGRLAQSSTRLK